MWPWTRKRKTEQPPTEATRHPHPDRDCDRTCDITDEAHGYGAVFYAEKED